MKRLGSVTAALATLMAFIALPAGPAQSVVAPHPHRVVVIIFENKAYTKVVGSPSAPYFNLLMHSGTLFTNYAAIRNGSTRNYRAISSGLTEGRSTGNIFRAIDDTRGRLKWVELNESMRNNCGDGSTGVVPGTHVQLYYTGHDYAILNRSSESCEQNDMPLTNATFAPDKLPDLTFLVPNMCTIMHTPPTGTSCPAFFGTVNGAGSLQLGDAWLKRVVPQLLTQPDITVVVTFDEGADSSHQHIVTLEVGAGVAPGGRDSHAYTHYGLLAGLYKTFGLGIPPNNAAHAVPLPIG